MTEIGENVADEPPVDAENNNGTDTANTYLKASNENQEEIHRLLSILETSDGSTDSEVLESLKDQTEQDLCIKLKEMKDANINLLKENEVYASSIQAYGSLTSVAYTTDLAVDKLLVLSLNLKCYYAKKRLKYLVKTLEEEKFLTESNILELQFKLESWNRSLDDLKASRTNFRRSVQISGLHPVTKKVMLQKVSKFFDDSIKFKMTLTTRYKIQIQSNTMESNKLLSQIKEQEKRLASLDLVKFQQAKFDHDKSGKSLIEHRDQLSKCKSKFSFLSQNVHDAKKNLEKEQGRIEQTKSAHTKKEYVKNVLVYEKARNEEKIKDLNEDMRKMSLDPRRHGIPEVFDYALVKRENNLLKQNIAMWKKKVSVVQQAKRIHLLSLKKK